MAPKYIRLKKQQKIPCDKWRQPDNQFTFDEIKFWLAAGGNIGFVCGETVVLDIDDLELAEELDLHPKPTKTARTSRGLHYYYHCPEATKLVFYDLLENKHVGELQCIGQYVVSPPSIHPDGSNYTWDENSPDTIATVTCQEIVSWFKGKASTKKAISCSDTIKWSKPYNDVPFHLSDIWPAGFKQIGSEILGPHPVHGSTTGQNLCIRGDLWHCFRCDSGGGPLEALAVDSGLIDCEEAHPGCLKGYTWFQLCAEAKRRNLI